MKNKIFNTNNLQASTQETNKETSKNMRRQANRMPSQTPNSHKSDPWGINRRKPKCNLELFNVSGEMKKQINKAFGNFIEDIYK